MKKNNEPQEILFKYLENVLYHPENANLDVDCLPEDFQKLGKGIKFVGECLMESDHLAKIIASGWIDEEVKIEIQNPLIAPLKTIQSNLNHLTYITGCVANGNYNQKIRYMGDLGDSINKMIEQLCNQKKEMEILASTDTLTGIGNRQKFKYNLKSLWESQKEFALAFIDIDGLKYCNDTLGHSEGDCYIKKICGILEENLKEKESIYRIGGDEFVILTSDIDADELEKKLEDIRKKYLELYVNDKTQPYGFSFGCVDVNPSRGGSTSYFLSLADQRMYDYKMAHRTQR
ncbi:MAG: diguanylate cyclase domain-containing protein [Lachnospiraceae bacterium]